MPAERGLYRLTRFVQRQLEGNVREYPRQLLSFHQAEFDRFRVLSSDLYCDFVPIFAGGERRCRVLHLVLGGCEDLLDLALLGQLELVLPLVELRLQLCLRNLDALSDIRRVEARQGEPAVFRGTEEIRMSVVERGEFGFARLSGIPGIGDRQRDDISNALLVPI